MGIGFPKLTFTELAGQYDAVIGILTLPNEQVSQMLPPNDVQLGVQEVTPPGTHPVLFLFGRHTNAHLAHFQWLYHEDYNEFIVGIPYVSLTTEGSGVAQEPLYYLPRLLLDKFLAVAGGVWWWGFEKQLAQISQAGDLYSVRGHLGNEDLISLQTKTMGVQSELSAFPFLFPVADMVSQPLLTKVFARLGPWATSTFDWKWNQAAIWPVEARMTISDAFLPGLPTGAFDLDSIEDTYLGTFRIRTNWTLSLPYSPRLVAGMRRALRPIAAG